MTDICAVSDSRRLQLLLSEHSPGFWTARALEHDVAAEARTMSDAVRGVVEIVSAHTAFDTNHRRAPMSAFRPAPSSFWKAFSIGTPVSLASLGMTSPAAWDFELRTLHSQRREP